MRCDGFEKIDARVLDVVRKTNPAATSFQQCLQCSLACNQRKLHEVVAVQIQQIESIKIDRNLLVGRRNILGTRQMNTWLQQVEMSLTVFIQGDDLAIEDSRVRRQVGKRGGECREPVNQALAVACPHIELCTVLDDYGSHAVEFQLE